MQDIIDEIPLKLKKHFDRHNYDRGEFRKAKKDLEDRIAEKELREEIRIVESGENIDFDIPEQDEIIGQIMGRV